MSDASKAIPLTDRLVREQSAWRVAGFALIIGLIFGGLIGYKLGRLDQAILRAAEYER